MLNPIKRFAPLAAVLASTVALFALPAISVSVSSTDPFLQKALASPVVAAALRQSLWASGDGALGKILFATLVPALIVAIVVAATRLSRGLAIGLLVAVLPGSALVTVAQERLTSAGSIMRGVEASAGTGVLVFSVGLGLAFLLAVFGIASPQRRPEEGAMMAPMPGGAGFSRG